MSQFLHLQSRRSDEEWRPFMDRLMAEFRRERKRRIWIGGGAAALAGAVAVAWILLTWSPRGPLPHAEVPTTEAALFVPKSGVVMVLHRHANRTGYRQEHSS